MLDNQNEFWIQLNDDFNGTKFGLFKRMNGFDEAWNNLKEDTKRNPDEFTKDIKVVHQFVHEAFLKEAHPKIFGTAKYHDVVDLCVLTHMLLCEEAMHFRTRSDYEELNSNLLRYYKLHQLVYKTGLLLTY